MENLWATAAIALSIMEAFGLVMALHAVSTVRSSQGAVAWSVSLITFPWLAVPLYLIFGRGKFKGYVEALRAGEANHAQATLALRDILINDRIDLKEGLPSGLEFFENLTQLPFTGANRVELLVNGPATFERMFDEIDRAQEYIILQYYIVHEDRLGVELKKRLLQKAAQGIKIYFQYDEIGCFQLPASYVEELRAGGVEMIAFKTTRGRGNRFQVNFRNHRKITLIDGETAFVGGHNVGDEYMGRDPKIGPWRDTHLLVQGPVVRQIQFSFLKDWYWSTGHALDLRWDVSWKAEIGAAPMLTLSTGPADRLYTCELLFVQAIQAAQERFWLASPYFVPSESVLTAMQNASLRGVDVRIMVPEKPDHRTVHLAGLSYLPQLNLPNIKVFRYQTGFLHQKAMLIDHNLAAVGTANADNRSFHLNFEMTMLVADRHFASEIQAMFEKDFQTCRLVNPNEYDRLNPVTKLAVHVARLFAPML